MVSSDTLLLAAGGFAASEALGVTNVTGGGGGGDGGGGNAGPSLPGLGNIELPGIGDVKLPGAPDIQLPAIDAPDVAIPQQGGMSPSDVVSLIEATGGGGGGGNGSRGGRNTGRYDIAKRGASDPIRFLAEAGKEAGNLAGQGGEFAKENPYFSAATAAGLSSPIPGDAALLAPVGAAAEVTADTVTGGTPLGVKSPVDLTGKGPWWQGPDFKPKLGKKAKKAGAVATASMTAPAAAADAAADAATSMGPLYKGPDPFNLGGGGGGGSKGGGSQPATKDNQQKQSVIQQQNNQQTEPEKNRDTMQKVRRGRRRALKRMAGV